MAQPRDPASDWPVVTFETFDWQSSWRTYQAAVVPAIAGLDVAERLDSATAGDVGAAQQAIIGFDAHLSSEFGPMELGTIDTVLLRSEAASSSQIEHLTVSSKQLALAEIGASKSVNAKLVRGNVIALQDAGAEGAFSTAGITRMQRDLLRDTGLHLGPRLEQVWIGTSGSTPVGADFVPPHHTRVEENLDDLWSFLAQPPGLPLAHVAVAHAQFETIHPFVDGNGRVGRALVHAYLRSAGLAEHVTVPISAGLLADTGGYVRALDAYRAGDPAPIVAEFSRAAQNAAAVGGELIGDLRVVRRSWDSLIKARRDSVAWRIADQLIGHPAITAEIAATRNDVSQAAARTAIAALVEAGILARASAGRRNQVWVAEEITSAYDRIAVLIGRRRAY